MATWAEEMQRQQNNSGAQTSATNNAALVNPAVTDSGLGDALGEIVGGLQNAFNNNPGYSNQKPDAGKNTIAAGGAGAGSAAAGAFSNITGGYGGPTIPGGSENLTEDVVDPGAGGYGGGGGGGRSSGGGVSPYTAPTLPYATSQADYINAMYDANRAAQEASLRSAYEANVNTLDQQAAQLPTTYNAAVNQANAQAAINRANFNEAAAASGLNTGAGSQARLAQNNALLGNVSQIRQAQAEAQANLDNRRAQLEQEYRNAIADAVAKNDLQRAQALYQEAKRVDESIVNTAINQANLDWSVWSRLYGR